MIHRPDALRDGLIASGCLLVAVAGFLLHSSRPAPAPATAVHVAKRPSAEKAAPTTWAPGAEPRVTFAHTMPRSYGTQVYTSAGTFNPALVTVAIPDGPKAVRFVRGSDPEAIKYLEDARAKQKLFVVDNGPLDVDTSEIVKGSALQGSTQTVGAPGAGR